jgi:hypothetical protein
MAGDYLLNWTDDGTIIPSKTPMQLNINTKDTTRAPIVLIGRNSQNYGEQLLENMLHILENFASSEEPGVKTVGMLWYNHGDSTTDLTGGISAIDLPFQTRDKSLNYYDGTKWVELISKEDFAKMYDVVRTALTSELSALDSTLRTKINADIAALNLSLTTKINSDILNLNTTLTNKINTDIASLSSDVHTDIAALDSTLRTKINTDVSALDGTLRTKIAAEVTTLNNTIVAGDTAVRGELAAVDTAIRNKIATEVAGLNSTITTTKNTLESEISSVNTDLHNDIAALDATIKSIISSGDSGVLSTLRGELSSLDTTLRSVIALGDSSVTSTLRGEISTLNTTLRNEISSQISTLNTSLRNEISSQISSLNTTLRNVISDSVSTLDNTLRNKIATDIEALDQSLRTVMSTYYTAINAASPKNGDLKTDSDGRIFLRANDTWRLVWPTLQSDLYVDTNYIDMFVGTPTWTSDSTKKGLGSLYGIGYGDVGLGLSSFPFGKYNSADYSASIVDIAHLTSMARAIHELTNYFNDSAIKDRASAAISYLTSTSNKFHKLDSLKHLLTLETLNELYDLISVSRSNRYKLLTADTEMNFITSTTSTTMSLSNLLSDKFITKIAATFNNSNEIRYFFNAGGLIRFNFQTTGDQTDLSSLVFASFLKKLNGIAFGAHETRTPPGFITPSRNGANTVSPSESESIGFYDLTYGVQTLIASTTFDVSGELTHRVDCEIYAKATGSATNGAPGSNVEFTIRFLHYEDGPTTGYGYGFGPSPVNSTGMYGAALQNVNATMVINTGSFAVTVNSFYPTFITPPSLTVIKNFG